MKATSSICAWWFVRWSQIEQDPARPRLIRNEPGIGYRLAAGDRR